jgi:hypothetical protein
LGNELMTGYLRSTTNPLSAITVGSIQDLGYTVNTAAASSYRVPALILAPSTTVDLQDAEIAMRPRHKVDRKGVQTIIGS